MKNSCITNEKELAVQTMLSLSPLHLANQCTSASVGLSVLISLSDRCGVGALLMKHTGSFNLIQTCVMLDDLQNC